MYQIKGSEFSALIDRKFTRKIAYRQSADRLDDVFSCETSNIRTNDFDILNFRANFKQELQVSNLVDTNHVSLHFQLAGSSNANITGFSDTLVMNSRSFNLMNCVDPVSSFSFPVQEKYEYLCIGLKPEFFNHILMELGENYGGLLSKSLQKTPFSLFKQSKNISLWQTQALWSMSAPISEDIRQAYLTAKIREILLLSINREENPAPVISSLDKEKLLYAKQYIEKNFLMPLSLSIISKATMLNEFKLKSGFRTLFNRSVFAYIHELRMQHAHELLSSTNCSVSEAATAAGYLADSAFIRAFGRYFGYSPGKMKAR